MEGGRNCHDLVSALVHFFWYTREKLLNTGINQWIKHDTVLLASRLVYEDMGGLTKGAGVFVNPSIALKPELPNPETVSDGGVGYNETIASF